MTGHVLKIYNLYETNSQFSKTGKAITFFLVSVSTVLFSLSAKWNWLLFIAIPLYFGTAVFSILVVDKLVSQHKEITKAKIVVFLQDNNLYNPDGIQILCRIFQYEGSKVKKDFLNVLTTLIIPLYGAMINLFVDKGDINSTFSLIMYAIVAYALVAIVKDVVLFVQNYKPKVCIKIAEFLEQDLLLSIFQDKSVA